MKAAFSLLGAALIGAASASFAQTPPPAAAASTPGVDQREQRQNARIRQGVESGTLTRREARRLQAEQNAIDRAEAKAKSDGKVTRAERARLHHMQDHASRDIARQKHDRQRRAASAP